MLAGYIFCKLYIVHIYECVNNADWMGDHRCVERGRPVVSTHVLLPHLRPLSLGIYGHVHQPGPLLRRFAPADHARHQPPRTFHDHRGLAGQRGLQLPSGALYCSFFVFCPTTVRISLNSIWVQRCELWANSLRHPLLIYYRARCKIQTFHVVALSLPHACIIKFLRAICSACAKLVKPFFTMNSKPNTNSKY
jgi:hypothetical protein